MHHVGGSGGRKKALRCEGVRQRGTAALAFETKPCVSGTSQIRAVPSKDPVTMRFPSGLNVALRSSSLPLSSPIGFPVAASQTRAVLSADAVTMRWPSVLNEALHTGAV